jgi:hypothetical protein
MMAVFSEFIEEIVEVFMDDFSIYGKTFMDFVVVKSVYVVVKC